MLSAYFDASGHESDQRYLVVAGFVSSAKDWVKFEAAWKERLKHDGITCFHMTDCLKGEREFRGWRDDEKRRERFLSDLMRIIKSHAYRKFAEVVEIKTYQQHVAEDVRKQYRIKAYSLAGRTCAARLREWLRAEWSSTTAITAIKLVFEAGDEGKGALSDRLIEDRFPKPLFEPKTDTVDKKSGLPMPGAVPLQAADYLAHTYFRAVRDMSEDCWRFQEFEKMPGRSGFYTISNLRELDANLKSLRDERQLLKTSPTRPPR